MTKINLKTANANIFRKISGIPAVECAEKNFNT